MNDFGLPEGKLFFKLREIKQMGLMSTERAKILLYRGDLSGVKNGQMWLIPRAELLRLIRENYSGELNETK